MVHVEGPELPYSTSYYDQSGTVLFISALGPLVAREVEGGEAVSLGYSDPSDMDCEKEPSDTHDKKLGTESVRLTMNNSESI